MKRDLMATAEINHKRHYRLTLPCKIWQRCERECITTADINNSLLKIFIALQTVAAYVKRGLIAMADLNQIYKLKI